jgi:REP element-mobilizing transposase RayT
VLLGVLADCAAAESVRVHAYVLMTNHVHLLMTPATERGVSLLALIINPPTPVRPPTGSDRVA